MYRIFAVTHDGPFTPADGEVAELVRAAIAETGATGMPQMGAVMKAAQAQAAGRVAGRRLSTEVRRQLAG